MLKENKTITSLICCTHSSSEIFVYEGQLLHPKTPKKLPSLHVHLVFPYAPPALFFHLSVEHYFI